MKSEMLARLSEHLNNTSIERLRSDWQEIEDLKIESPNVFEYLTYIESYSFTVEDCLIEEILIPKDMIPNFSGSCFLCNIAA